MKKTTRRARFIRDYPLCSNPMRRMQRSIAGTARFANKNAVFHPTALRRGPTTKWVSEAFFERRYFVSRGLARA